MVQRKVQQTTKASTKLRLQRLYSIKALLFCLFFFVACTSSHQWSAVHPSYKKGISSNDAIGIVGTQNAFILSRAKWFSHRLEIPMDSIHQKTDHLIISNFINEFKINYPQASVFPDSVEKDWPTDRKSTRLNSSHQIISYAVFCLKKKKNTNTAIQVRTPSQTPRLQPKKHITS